MVRHYLSKKWRHPEVAKWNREAIIGKPVRKPRGTKKINVNPDLQ